MCLYNFTCYIQNAVVTQAFLRIHEHIDSITICGKKAAILICTIKNRSSLVIIIAWIILMIIIIKCESITNSTSMFPEYLSNMFEYNKCDYYKYTMLVAIKYEMYLSPESEPACQTPSNIFRWFDGKDTLPCRASNGRGP